MGLAGWSGAGKTTLIEAVLPRLVAGGLTVSTVKHAHHAFEVDRPGKDSYRHREAGAREVLVASARRYAILHEARGEPEPGLAALLARLEPVDLVLVEGFRADPHPKLEVHRLATAKPLLHPGDPCVLAIATDAPGPFAVTRLGLDEHDAIAAWIAREARPTPA